MKVLHVLTGLLLFALLIALSGAVGYLALSAETWRQALARAGSERLLALSGGIVLFLLVLLFLLTGVPRRVSEQFVTFENENGSVSVSAQAIAGLIERVRDEFAAVIELKPAIRPVGGSIGVDLDVKVRGGTQIPELCRLLQERVRETIRENLGLADIRGVRIAVREIVVPRREKQKAEETAT